MDAALTRNDLSEISQALDDYESVTCWAIRVVDADVSTTFAKQVGGANLFGQSSGGFTYYRELLTEAPTAKDWVESLEDQIAELEGYGWGADYDARIIVPLRAARAEIAQTLTA